MNTRVFSHGVHRPGRVGFRAIVGLVLGVVAIGLGILSVGNALFGSGRGQRLAVTDKEEIYYKNVSKEEAERLGQGLKDIGYFTGATAKTVQLSKNDSMFVLSFVVKDGFWDNADFVDGVRLMALQLSSRVFDGQPILLRLCDKNLNEKLALTLDKENLGKRLAVSPQEEIYYRDVKEEQAQKLGDVLQKIPYFDGKGARTVAVGRDAGKLRLTFVVAPGKWDDDTIVRQFLSMARRVRQEVFNSEPMDLCLADDKLRVKKTQAVD